MLYMRTWTTSKPRKTTSAFHTQKPTRIQLSPMPIASAWRSDLFTYKLLCIELNFTYSHACCGVELMSCNNSLPSDRAMFCICASYRIHAWLARLMWRLPASCDHCMVLAFLMITTSENDRFGMHVPARCVIRQWIEFIVDKLQYNSHTS